MFLLFLTKKQFFYFSLHKHENFHITQTQKNEKWFFMTILHGFTYTVYPRLFLKRNEAVIYTWYRSYINGSGSCLVLSWCCLCLCPILLALCLCCVGLTGLVCVSFTFLILHFSLCFGIWHTHIQTLTLTRNPN